MTRVPNIANWGVFTSKHIFMLATVAANDSTSTVRKKYSDFINSEAEPHAMYAIYEQTRTLCVLQYSKSALHSIAAGRPSLACRAPRKKDIILLDANVHPLVAQRRKSKTVESVLN